jgi:hypothetical protein
VWREQRSGRQPQLVFVAQAVDHADRSTPCRTWGVKYDKGDRGGWQGSRCAAGLLPLAGPALEAFAYVERHRKLIRDPPARCAPRDVSHRVRHDLQARRATEKSWCRLDASFNPLRKVVLGVKFNEGIEVVRPQAQAAAAGPFPSPRFGYRHRLSYQGYDATSFQQPSEWDRNAASINFCTRSPS